MKDYKVKNKKKVVAKKSYKKDVYAFGGTVQDRLNDYLQIQTDRKNSAPNLIQTPDAAIVESQIRDATAMGIANKNFGVKATNFLGQAGLQIGGGMMSDALAKDPDAGKFGGKDGKGGFDFGNLSKFVPALGTLGSFAMGGTVMPQQNIPVEAEGGEMVKLPGDATSTEIKGPSHENGGVDMALPEGTQVFSKRLGKETDKLDKSYAEREKARKRYIERLQAQLDKDPTNQILENTFFKVSNDAKIASEKDIAEMEAKKLELQYADNSDAMNLYKSANSIDQALEGSQKQYAAYGGKINPPKKKFFTTNYDDPYNPAIETNYKDQYNNQEANQADLYNKMFNPNTERNNNIKDWADTTSSPISKYSMPMPSLNGANNYEKLYNMVNIPSYKQDTGEYNNTVNTDNSFKLPQQDYENPFNDTLLQSKNSDLSNFTRPGEKTKTGGKGADMVQNFMKGKNGITTGDALGLYGMYKGMNDPMNNTLANRAGDTVNSNFYKDYGKEGIKVLEDSKRMLMANKDQAMLDAQSQYTNLGARSANVMNSLKLVEQMGKNQNITNANLNYSNQKNAIQSQIAGAENQQDQIVMQGEEQANTKNQQDRDNFNKQMARDIETKNFGMQKIGGTLNQVKERNVNLNLIDQLQEDFGINGMTGQMRRKAVETIKNNPQFYTDLSREDGDIIHKGVASGELVVKNNKLYDKNGVELDKKTRKPFGYVAPTEEPIPQVTQEQINNGDGYSSMRFNPVSANPFLTPKLR